MGLFSLKRRGCSPLLTLLLAAPAVRAFAMSAVQHFVINAQDKDNSLQLRLANREKHLQFVNSPPSGKVQLAGPFLDEKGSMCGSLLIVQVTSYRKKLSRGRVSGRAEAGRGRGAGGVEAAGKGREEADLRRRRRAWMGLEGETQTLRWEVGGGEGKGGGKWRRGEAEERRSIGFDGAR